MHRPTGLADIAAEAILVAGGARAILLQVADPAIGEAVARHSDFARFPMRRLRHTLEYVYAVAYGDEAERREAVRGVDAAHAGIAGTRDPELQLWVAATLYDTAIRVHERVFGLLDADLAETVYRQYAILGTALQVPERAWPADRAAFGRYWEGRLAGLEVTSASLRIAHDILYSRTLPRALRAAMPLARLVTAGLLPARVREAYGFRWTVRRARRFALAFGCVSALYRLLPRWIRTLPRDRSLAAVRRRVAARSR